MISGTQARHTRARDRLERVCGILDVALAPGGLRALLTWNPRSAAAFRITMAVAYSGVTPATVLDIGANIGQFSRAAIGRWPRSQIIAFEPLSSAAGRLRRMLAKVSDRHIVYELALGSSDGETVFWPHRYSLSSSVLPVADPSRYRYSWAQEAPPITVPMARLDHVLGDVVLDRPVLVKIDVQGYEKEVLAGAKGVLQAADCLVIEQSFQPFYKGQSRASDVVEHLTSSGWELCGVVDIRREGGLIVEADMLYRRRAAIEDR